MKNEILRVCLQLTDQGLDPVSRKILTTARWLGSEGGLQTEGVLFLDRLTSGGKNLLEHSGLDRVRVWEGPEFAGFLPERQVRLLSGLEACQVLLFPATPEGRCLSSMTAAVLGTGVTADCTALSFTEEGLLKQVRPAFSGSRMAEIVTRSCRPQIASLRFGMPVSEPEGKTEVICSQSGEAPAYPVCWVERTEKRRDAHRVVLAVGGGLRTKEDLHLAAAGAERLQAELFCSRALVDRGWIPRSHQIGLSGQSISAELLITLGISGSVQFQAGLERIGKLCAVDLNPRTPLMRLADVPIQGDLYEILSALTE